MVSVIIPIYNVKQYVERGIQNILNQTYQDFEILLSDDGSTDGSYELCQKYAQRDCRIRVLHQENMGAGAARNHGLNEARGKYIYFYDIDDEISPHLLEYNLSKMDQLDVDFLMFGYKNVEPAYGSETIVSFPEIKIDCNEELRDIFVDEFIMKTNGFPWNKFYRKSFLDAHNLRFENQRIQQDEVFNLMVYQHLQRAYISPEILYTYYVYDRGNTRSFFISDRFDIYKSVRSHFETLIEFWKLDDNRLTNYLKKRFYDSVIQCLQFNLTHPDCPWTREEKKAEIDRIMNDPLTIEAFSYADENIGGIEAILSRWACRQRNLYIIKGVTAVFNALHAMRRKIK